MYFFAHLQGLDSPNMSYSFGSGLLTGLLMSVEDPDLHDFFSDMTNVYIKMRNELCTCLIEDDRETIEELLKK